MRPLIVVPIAIAILVGAPASGVDASTTTLVALAAGDSVAPAAGDSTAAVRAADSSDAARPSNARPQALSARIDAVAKAGNDLPETERRVLAELVAAARDLAAEGDSEAALLVLDDAQALVRDRGR